MSKKQVIPSVFEAKVKLHDNKSIVRLDGLKMLSLIFAHLSEDGLNFHFDFLSGRLESMLFDPIVAVRFAVVDLAANVASRLREGGTAVRILIYALENPDEGVQIKAGKYIGSALISKNAYIAEPVLSRMLKGDLSSEVRQIYKNTRKKLFTGQVRNVEESVYHKYGISQFGCRTGRLRSDRPNKSNIPKTPPK
jgi:hypothetical protein